MDAAFAPSATLTRQDRAQTVSHRREPVLDAASASVHSSRVKSKEPGRVLIVESDVIPIG